MRDAVYRKLLQEDFAFYNRNRTGDLMSRQTGDMDAIRHFVAYVIYIVYENILYFLSDELALANLAIDKDNPFKLNLSPTL